MFKLGYFTKIIDLTVEYWIYGVLYFFICEINYYLHENSETFYDLWSFFLFWNPFISLGSSQVPPKHQGSIPTSLRLSLSSRQFACDTLQTFIRVPFPLHISFLCLVLRFQQTSRLRCSLISWMDLSYTPTMSVWTTGGCTDQSILVIINSTLLRRADIWQLIIYCQFLLWGERFVDTPTCIFLHFAIHFWYTLSH